MDPVQRRTILRRLGPDGQAVVIPGDLDPEAAGTRAIPDPIEQPREAFEASYARIDRCVRELASVLAGAEER